MFREVGGGGCRERWVAGKDTSMLAKMGSGSYMNRVATKLGGHRTRRMKKGQRRERKKMGPPRNAKDGQIDTRHRKRGSDDYDWPRMTAEGRCGRHDRSISRQHRNFSMQGLGQSEGRGHQDSKRRQGAFHRSIVVLASRGDRDKEGKPPAANSMRSMTGHAGREVRGECPGTSQERKSEQG